KAEGIEKWYYENGNLWREIPYKNNKAEGIEKWYYENGKLMAEIPYLNNLFHGDTRFYTEDGKLLALFKGENDRITSGKCFDDKVLTDKEIDDLSRPKSIEESINYLKEICSK
ncbi:toxin-antitoxin system YwqK family antitoxin, partial [Helicobacter bilis]|uniref:toxin-antitoxin system YwqK family antitoxin n=1 Tax=Helicobacter bilis TaxID=37372 RepID=UPI003977EE9A